MLQCDPNKSTICGFLPPLLPHFTQPSCINASARSQGCDLTFPLRFTACSLLLSAPIGRETERKILPQIHSTSDISSCSREKGGCHCLLFFRSRGIGPQAWVHKCQVSHTCGRCVVADTRRGCMQYASSLPEHKGAEMYLPKK